MQMNMLAKTFDVFTNEGVVKKYLDDFLPELLSFAVQLIIAILLLIIGTKIVKWVTRHIIKGMERKHVDAGLRTFLGSLIKYGLYFVLGMMILSQFGVTTSSVVALLGSAGVTIGLAMQGSLSNFAGGVLILLMKPFSVGDYIIEHGTNKEGTVSAITLFYTKLTTVDNKVIMIPNGKLAGESITNVSMMDKRRVDIRVGVSYESDLAKVKEVLNHVIDEETTVLREEPIQVFVAELADSSIEMELRVWVKSEDYWDTKWRLTENVKISFDKNAISIPFPQLDVQIKQ
ncbi:MAG: mechanosensitive ion channel [Agathobacter sp.]|nr:mechanosensitive ion channel [Agathobacter sp.]